MKLNELIAQALNKPVDDLTVVDVIWALEQEVFTRLASESLNIVISLRP